MSYGTRHTVLLIEQDPSLRRLMALGLLYRGMRVIEATSPLRLPGIDIEEQPPDLLLLDIDGGVNSNWSLLAAIQSHPALSTLPLVVLAWENVLLGLVDTHHSATHATPATPATPPAQARMTCLTKPFDARTLHATIENLLLESAPAPQTANAALATQELLLLAQTASSTPSIWPVITAAALLLTVIGLMVHITITLVGLFIFLIALLGWALDSKPETPPAPCT
jgi:CheY-like chemotaxis protein